MKLLDVREGWAGLVAFALIGAFTGLVVVGLEEGVKHSLEEFAKADSWVIGATLVVGGALGVIAHALPGR